MEIRDRIIDEATNQFFKYGIRNVTMDNIALALGISKRTVYETFKDKGELIQICLQKISESGDKATFEVVSQTPNVIEAIFVFMEEGIKAINSINPVFYMDMKKFYPVIWKKMEKEVIGKRSDLSMKLISKGISEGLFRNDLNVEIIAKLFHEQINLLSDDTVFPRNKYSDAEVFQNMIINFVRGISTQSGIETIERILK